MFESLDNPLTVKEILKIELGKDFKISKSENTDVINKMKMRRKLKKYQRELIFLLNGLIHTEDKFSEVVQNKEFFDALQLLV